MHALLYAHAFGGAHMHMDMRPLLGLARQDVAACRGEQEAEQRGSSSPGAHNSGRSLQSRVSVTCSPSAVSPLMPVLFLSTSCAWLAQSGTRLTSI